MYKAIWGCLMSCLLSLSLVQQARALDTAQIESKIHALTNQLRAEQKLPPLAPLSGLQSIARKHSQAMASQGFFSHQDLENHSPFDRMKLFLPGLLSMGSGENIAMRSLSGNENTLAMAIFQQWKNSPGHYSNMISTGFRHLGVGIAINQTNLYATQNFANGLVMASDPIMPSVITASTARLKFEYLADFPKSELSIFVHVPDTKARFYTASGSFYTGGGPLEPKWLDQTHFEIEIPTDKGLGEYTLGIGRNGSYYDTHFGINVIAKP